MHFENLLYWRHYAWWFFIKFMNKSNINKSSLSYPFGKLAMSRRVLLMIMNIWLKCLKVKTLK